MNIKIYKITIILFLPLLLNAQYLAKRYFFQVAPLYFYNNFDSPNNTIQNLETNTTKPFNNPLVFSMGIGYAINNFLEISINYLSATSKSYNRNTTLGSDRTNYTLEYNSNFKIPIKALTLNINYYLINTPLLGLSIEGALGSIIDAKFIWKIYETKLYEGTTEKIVTKNNSLIYKNADPYFLGQLGINLDISLGVLTSLIFSAGYQIAKIHTFILKEASGTISNPDPILTDSLNKKTFLDLSAIYVKANLRFLF